MLLIHMADAHFGKRFSSSRFGPEAAKIRRRALETAIKLLVLRANELKADYILCAGDLIESAEATPADFRNLSDLLSGLISTKMLVISGNHDPHDRMGVYSRFTPPKNMIVLPAGYSRQMLSEETALHAFSFPEAIVRTNPLEDQTLDLSARHNILLLHGDAFSGDSQYLPVSPDFLKKFDYCALGHIHQPLEILPHARYSGSLIGMDRNETGPRGFVRIEIGNDLFDRFEPLPIPTYENLRVAIEAEMSESAVETALREHLFNVPSENLYSITLTGTHAAGARPNLESLTERLQRDGFYVYLIDQTRPSYDLEELFIEHRDDLIGQVINAFGPEGGLDEKGRLALEYAITALMEGGLKA